MTKKKDPSELKKNWRPPLRAMIRFKAYPNETWKDFFPEGQTRRYMVSNLGRIASFYEDINVDGFILKLSIGGGGAVSGMKLSLRRYVINEAGKRVYESQSFQVHYVVAEHFLKKTHEDQTRVIHLDHDKMNNIASNLRWVTPDEALAHLKINPAFTPRMRGPKLTVDRVRLIKRKLAEGKTKQGILAKQFGLSEMGIYRIKTGKSWANITI